MPLHAAQFTLADGTSALITLSENGDNLKIRTSTPKVMLVVTNIGLPGVIGPDVKIDVEAHVTKEIEEALEASKKGM